VNVIIILKLIEIKKRKRHLTSTNAHIPLVPTSNNKNNGSVTNGEQKIKRSPTIKNSNLDLRVTFMVLTVVLAFFLFQSPYLIIRMIPLSQRGKWWEIIKVLSDLFLALNFSINFLIYCFFGQNFRTIAFEYILKLGLGKIMCKK
jgi:phosphate starvation-inducible membrane PsiE